MESQRCLSSAVNVAAAVDRDRNGWGMSLRDLAAMSDDEIRAADVAMLNLAAANGLPGAESLDVPALIARLDQWASLVAVNTRHWRRKFTPTDDCPTEAHFRMMAMLTVVQRDLGVRYNPACMTGLHDTRDSRDNFIHGLLTGHGGTCCSLPVLYVAIGRRLGYPLYLVVAREHLFVRWDDGRKQPFNVECAGIGFITYSDEHYTLHPKPLSAKQLRTGFYLRNLTPREELASFIADRGHCLLDNLRLTEAMEAYMYATRLDRLHEGGWAVATAVARIVSGIVADQRGGLPANLPQRVRIDLASPQPKNAGERWALPLAQEEVLRIARIRAKPKPEINLEPVVHIVTPT